MPSTEQRGELIMRWHNNLGRHGRFGERCFLTERQFLRFVGPFKEDTMTNSVGPFTEDITTKREAIYSRFEAFEERLAHCYFLLQERFIAEPVLSRFWAVAALEELQHQSMLRFCRE